MGQLIEDIIGDNDEEVLEELANQKLAMMKKDKILEEIYNLKSKFK